MVQPLPALRHQCPACGRVLSLHERHADGGYCGDAMCRHRRYEARRKQELDTWMHADRDAAAAASGDPTTAEAPVVVVRWYDTPLEPVPDSQREALHAHLMALEAEVDALLAAPPPEEAEADLPPALTEAQQVLANEVDGLLGQVCARCTGYCCRLGFARQAFLDAEALVRERQRAPTASHAQIAAGYLAALPALHHAGSCAYHGERGCVLPRERRAAICNSFECPGLEATRRFAERDGVRRVYVVRHHGQDGPLGAFAPPVD